MTNYTNQTANSTKTESKFEIRFNKNYTIATVSKEFKEQMFDYGSEAYNIAQNIRSFYPNITFRVASNHVQKTKKITYEAMKKHLKAKIVLAEGEEKKDLEKALAQFEAIKALSQIQHNPYRYMLAWFKGVCPELFSKKNTEVEESAEAAQSQEDQQMLTINDLVAAA